MRYLILLLALIAMPAMGQTRDCVSTTCTIVSDPWPATGAQPTSCVLYAGATQIVESPVAGTTGAVYCSFTRNFAAGTYTLTATGKNSGGESSQSNSITLVSKLGAPNPPTNLRIQTTQTQALK